MVGIAAFGAYIPRRRLQRAAIFQANGWFNAGLKALARGERAMAGWDEDAITLAVEAARDCLIDQDRARVASILLASTSLPYVVRQNAGVVKEALNLRDEVSTADVTGSLRAGVSGLLQALQVARGGAGDVLCLAAERRPAKPASEAEYLQGDGSAAILVSTDAPMATLIVSHSVSLDFVDQFRETGVDYSYGWESRWVRDEGFLKIVPAAIQAALTKASLDPADVDRFVMAAPLRGVNVAVAKACGVSPAAVQDALAESFGDAGAAQPLILLADALAKAQAGEVIVLVGFGQGCDVLVFRTTEAIARPSTRLGVSGWLDRRAAENNYLKLLYFSGEITLDGGMRAEADNKTALTTLFRNRKAVLGLVGGRCTQTGTVQFPKSEVGVSRDRRTNHTQEDYPLADRVARVLTFTADALAYTRDPPGYYGMIEFDGGGRMVAEFADVDAEDVGVGRRMRMMFRIKEFDEQRGFRRYFWKAVPDYRAGAADQTES